MTYTYVVTNLGDTTLSDVSVVDNILGGIGVVGTLAPGTSVTLTKTMIVAADSEPINVATAVGTDALGKQVSDTDDAVITVVLGIVLELPRTGFPIGTSAYLGLALLASGLALQSVRRRRRLA